jgi:hypothetical protein
MRLHKGDMVEIKNADGRADFMTVIRLGGAAGTVHLARHCPCGMIDDREGADLAQAPHKPRAFAARSLQKHHAWAIRVDPAGNMVFCRQTFPMIRTRCLGGGSGPLPDAHA